MIPAAVDGISLPIADNNSIASATSNSRFIMLLRASRPPFPVESVRALPIFKLGIQSAFVSSYSMDGFPVDTHCDARKKFKWPTSSEKMGQHLPQRKWSEHTRAYFDGVQFFLFMRFIHSCRRFMESSFVLSPWCSTTAGMLKNETPFSRPLRL